jgi:16S rRNA pseudouridine516 synthase
VGNRVEALHRSAFGPVTLDGLAAGEWRWLERAALDAPR